MHELPGANYTMTSGTGTCSVIANQAGNSTYAAAAQVTKTVTATLATQTISISNLPANAVYGSSYVAAYSYTGNGTPSVSSGTTSVCTASGSSVSFVGVGTCSLKASATATTELCGGDGQCSELHGGSGHADNHVHQRPDVGRLQEQLHGGGQGGASGQRGDLHQFRVMQQFRRNLHDDQRHGNVLGDRQPGGQLGLLGSAAGYRGRNRDSAAQTITYTTNPPATAAYKTSFTVAATGGASGNAVTFTSSGSCTNSGATYTMTSGTGTCSVIANQAGQH